MLDLRTHDLEPNARVREKGASADPVIGSYAGYVKDVDEILENARERNGVADGGK